MKYIILRGLYKIGNTEEWTVIFESKKQDVIINRIIKERKKQPDNPLSFQYETNGVKKELFRVGKFKQEKEELDTITKKAQKFDAIIEALSL